MRPSEACSSSSTKWIRLFTVDVKQSYVHFLGNFILNLWVVDNMHSWDRISPPKNRMSSRMLKLTNLTKTKVPSLVHLATMIHSTMSSVVWIKLLPREATCLFLYWLNRREKDKIRAKECSKNFYNGRVLCIWIMSRSCLSISLIKHFDLRFVKFICIAKPFDTSTWNFVEVFVVSWNKRWKLSIDHSKSGLRLVTHLVGRWTIILPFSEP